MRPFESKHLLHRLARAALLLTVTSQKEFNCGDCERHDRCGLPPDDACIVRATQIARNSQSRFLSRSPHADDPFPKARF